MLLRHRYDSMGYQGRSPWLVREDGREDISRGARQRSARDIRTRRCNRAALPFGQINAGQRSENLSENVSPIRGGKAASSESGFQPPAIPVARRFDSSNAMMRTLKTPRPGEFTNRKTADAKKSAR